MALSSEDKKDVKGALGKAMANKISKVTRDSNKKKKSAYLSDPSGVGHGSSKENESRLKKHGWMVD